MFCFLFVFLQGQHVVDGSWLVPDAQRFQSHGDISVRMLHYYQVRIHSGTPLSLTLTHRQHNDSLSQIFISYALFLFILSFLLPRVVVVSLCIIYQLLLYCPLCISVLQKSVEEWLLKMKLSRHLRPYQRATSVSCMYPFFVLSQLLSPPILPPGCIPINLQILVCLTTADGTNMTVCASSLCRVLVHCLLSSCVFSCCCVFLSVPSLSLSPDERPTCDLVVPPQSPVFARVLHIAFVLTELIWLSPSGSSSSSHSAATTPLPASAEQKTERGKEREEKEGLPASNSSSLKSFSSSLLSSSASPSSSSSSSSSRLSLARSIHPYSADLEAMRVGDSSFEMGVLLNPIRELKWSTFEPGWMSQVLYMPYFFLLPVYFTRH